MGFMDFIKNAGKKIGIGDDEPQAEATTARAAPTAEQIARHNARAAERIREHLAELGLDFDGLEIAYAEHCVTLGGTAPDQAHKEKLVLAVGNLNGVHRVDEQLEVELPTPPAVYHTVVAGDTLSKLARHYYGVLRMYDHIFESNQPMLKDPDEIFPGQVLRIPPVAAPVITVKRGDTLSKLAKHWYGDPKKYPLIFEANRGVVSDPNVIKEGWILSIPLVDPKVPGCDDPSLV